MVSNNHAVINTTQFHLCKSLIFIFSCPKGSVISLYQVPLGIKTNFFFFVNIGFSQMFTINAKTYLDMLFLNFCGYWSRVCTPNFSVLRPVLLTVPIILKEGKHGSKEKKVFLFLFCLGFSPIKLETLWKVSFYLNNNSHAVCVEDSKLRNRVEVKKDHNNQKCQLPFKIDIPIR